MKTEKDAKELADALTQRIVVDLQKQGKYDPETYLPPIVGIFGDERAGVCGGQWEVKTTTNVLTLQSMEAAAGRAIFLLDEEADGGMRPLQDTYDHMDWKSTRDFVVR